MLRARYKRKSFPSHQYASAVTAASNLELHRAVARTLLDASKTNFAKDLVEEVDSLFCPHCAELFTSSRSRATHHFEVLSGLAAAGDGSQSTWQPATLFASSQQDCVLAVSAPLRMVSHCHACGQTSSVAVPTRPQPPSSSPRFGEPSLSPLGDSTGTLTRKGRRRGINAPRSSDCQAASKSAANSAEDARSQLKPRPTIPPLHQTTFRPSAASPRPSAASPRPSAASPRNAAITQTSQHDRALPSSKSRRLSSSKRTSGGSSVGNLDDFLASALGS